MSPLPQAFLEHLRTLGYHPRSDKHSNALATAIVDDLLLMCPELANRAKAGTVVYDLNFDLHFQTATWNVDLVLGRPAQAEEAEGAGIRRTAPSTVEIAIEIKSVMTEHRKAVKNRKRDIEAHHEHVHSYNESAIAGGVLVVNRAGQFYSPLRAGGTITTHGHGDPTAVTALLSHCILEMRNVRERSRVGETGLDAKCAIVVDMDNVNYGNTSYDLRPPAPQPGDPLHFDAFLQRICTLYE